MLGRGWGRAGGSACLLVAMMMMPSCFSTSVSSMFTWLLPCFSLSSKMASHSSKNSRASWIFASLQHAQQITAGNTNGTSLQQTTMAKLKNAGPVCCSQAQVQCRCPCYTCNCNLNEKSQMLSFRCICFRQDSIVHAACSSIEKAACNIV